MVQGYDPNLSYGLMAEGGQAVLEGALFVASNGDRTIPGGDGPPRPGNGALLQVIRTATGVDPIVTGKPERPLHREAVIRTGAQRPLVVGDRLDTDIEGAHNGGADSLLVFTGVTDPLTAVIAPPQHRPTYLGPDLTTLLAPYPRIRSEDLGYGCGGWTARWRPAGPADPTSAERIELAGGGDPYDGLRALCAVAWSTERPVPAQAVGAALDRLGFS